MSDLLIIQNITREGPGLLEQILIDQNITFDIVDLDKNQALPDAVDYKALVVLGGPDSANDTTLKMTKELAYIERSLTAGVPYLGICLGLQTLVKAAGGQVVAGTVKEVGFINPDGDQHTVTVTETGKSDPLLAGLPETVDVFQLHGETVELNSEMTVLATGKFCRNQIIKVTDKAYGIQSHFEVTPGMLRVWSQQDPDLVPIGETELLAKFEAIAQSYTHTGQTLLKNFLKIANLA